MKNILILFTDQQRYDTIREIGNENIQTPNLDSLARDSVIFDRALTPSPVCVPARLSLLAGRYPARTGCNTNNKLAKYQGNGFYQMLTDAGFYSCNVGKMHNSRDPYGPLGFCERHTQEELSQPDDDYTKFIVAEHPDVFDYNGIRSEMYYVPQVSQLPAEAHPTQWVGDRSVEFLEAHDKEKPFFLFSSFIHPHPPFCPPAPWNKLYRRESIPAPFVPENYLDLKPLLHTSFDCERLGITPLAAKRLKNYYYACVSFVDYQIGRIIKVLKDRGMYDDTMIVFTSDHGECLGDYSNMGKRTMLDSACHIPFMMKVPGVEPCRRSDVVSLVDVAPTVLSWAGVDYSADEFDGVDLFSEKHDYIYSQYSNRETGAYMIASATEKLIFTPVDGKYYYFDEFPEVHNKYDESNPHISELRDMLMTYYHSDVGELPKGNGKKKKAPNDFATGWMDHVNRHDEELARIPAPYIIDLP